MTAQNKTKATPARVALVLMTSLLVACSPIKRNYGYTPPESDLAQLSIGKDNRDTVSELIGAPLNEGMQRDDTWYYVSSRRQTRGLLPPEITDRQIVALSFTQSGSLQNIQRYGLQDGRVITLSRRVTDDSVPDINLIRRIFGNLGTPTAGEFLN